MYPDNGLKWVKIAFYALAIIIPVLLTGATVARAADVILYSQTDKSSFDNGQVKMYFGDTGSCGQFSGEVKAITYHAKWSSGGTQAVQMRLSTNPNAGGTAWANAYLSTSTTVVKSTTGEDYTATFDTYVDLYADCVNSSGSTASWQLDFLTSGTGFQQAYSTADVFANAQCRASEGCDTDGGDAYFIIYSPDNLSRIISQNAPGNGSITTSTSVTFDFDYYFNSVNDTYDTAGAEVIFDVQSVQIPQQDILASGESNYTETVTLTAGGSYLWRAYLLDSETGQKLFSNAWHQFYVQYNPYPLSGTDISSTSASSTINVLSFFSGIASFVYESSPFGYIFVIKDEMENLSTSTPAFEITVDSNLDSLVFEPLRTGFTWLMWVLLLVHIVHRVTNIHFA